MRVSTPTVRWSGVAAACVLVSQAALAFDTAYPYAECAPRSQRELFTPPRVDETTTPRPVTPVKLDISFYGDSRITSKCYVRNADGSVKEYSTHARSLAAKAVAPTGKTFAQRGRDGTSLQQLEAGQDGLAFPGATFVTDANDTAPNLPWTRQMDPKQGDNADIVVIAHGTNDAWQDLKWSTGNNVSTFEARLDRMVKQALASKVGRKVLLVQPFRACSYAMVDPSWTLRRTVTDGTTTRDSMRHPDTILAPYAAAVARVGLANNVHVAPLFSVPTQCSGDYSNTDMPDGLHATAAFTDKLAAVVTESLQRVINNRPLSDVKPSFTLLRAPFQQLTAQEMTAVAGRTTYPTISPAAGQDYQTLQPGTGRNDLPVLQLSNWVSANANSVSVACSVSLNNAPYSAPAWNGLSATYVDLPGAMPADGTVWDCNWTAVGPGGSVTVPETFRVGGVSGSTIDASSPRVTVARSQMPLVAGKPFSTTWRAENANSLYRWCSAPGTGMKDSTWTLIPLSSDPNANVGAKATNFALLNGQVTAQADPAWIGNRSTCQWAAVGSTKINYFYEYVNTIAP